MRIESGCLIFTGTKPNGYGALSSPQGKPPSLVHRIAWEHFHGPIPDGLWVLHHCDTPACFEIDHLYLGTHQDNMNDMHARGRHYNSLKTHCPAGHPYDETNTQFQYSATSVDKKGRNCRTCNIERGRAFYLARRVNLNRVCLTCGTAIPNEAHGKKTYCGPGCRKTPRR